MLNLYNSNNSNKKTLWIIQNIIWINIEKSSFILNGDKMIYLLYKSCNICTEPVRFASIRSALSLSHSHSLSIYPSLSKKTRVTIRNEIGLKRRKRRSRSKVRNWRVYSIWLSCTWATIENLCFYFLLSLPLFHRAFRSVCKSVVCKSLRSLSTSGILDSLFYINNMTRRNEQSTKNVIDRMVSLCSDKRTNRGLERYGERKRENRFRKKITVVINIVLCEQHSGRIASKCTRRYIKYCKSMILLRQRWHPFSGKVRSSVLVFLLDPAGLTFLERRMSPHRIIPIVSAISTIRWCTKWDEARIVRVGRACIFFETVFD